MQSSTKKLDHLVSVRGLAAWLVVLFHSSALWYSAVPQTPLSLLRAVEHGYLAVDFFFVLSGFIIFINYYEKFGVHFGHNSLIFYWNRISRIYPVHLLMLGAYLLLCAAFLYRSASHSLPDGYTFSEFWRSLLLVHAWGDTALSWNVPSWSISAEWFVYLWFPVIASCLRRGVRSVASHIIAVICTLILIVVIYNAVDAESLGSMRPGMLLTRALCEFLLGALAGSMYIYHAAVLQRVRTAVVLSIIVVLAVMEAFAPPNYATIPFLFFLLVVTLVTDKGWLSRSLSSRVLVYLGEISYSTYLVHYFVYDVFKAGWVHGGEQVSIVALLASFAVVLLMSMLMYKFVEIPAQAFLRGGLWARHSGPLRFRH
jgi:peptidoglycan/LPS O-acetylase OafA/YrhL